MLHTFNHGKDQSRLIIFEHQQYINLKTKTSSIEIDRYNSTDQDRQDDDIDKEGVTILVLITANSHALHSIMLKIS